MSYILLIFLLILVLNTTDGITTIFALQKESAVELNPLVQTLYSSLGVFGIVALKVAYNVVMVGIYFHEKNKKSRVAGIGLLLIPAALFGLTTFNNVAYIMFI